MKSSIKLLSWSSWMASISVVTVTSAWLLAELSTSPLINSLLIGAQNLPALLPLARTIKGVRVFIGATFLLELIVVCLYFQLLPNWVLIVSTLMVVLLASCGSITSLLPMTGIVLEGNTITNQSIQQGADVGSMSGTLISGVVYPYLKLFPPSILLVLAPAWLSKNNFRKIRSMSVVDVPIPVKVPPTDRWCLLQGFCVGSLFALLPLWVLSLKDGFSVDYSMILGAYMLGRIFTNRLLPKLSIIILYLFCAGLIFIAFYPSVPIWLDVLIFIPLGASITQIEFDLIDHLHGHGDLPLRRDILFRSLAIASVLGSLVSGMIGQAIGIQNSLFLVALIYGLAALLSWRFRPPSESVSIIS